MSLVFQRGLTLERVFNPFSDKKTRFRKGLFEYSFLFPGFCRRAEWFIERDSGGDYAVYQVHNQKILINVALLYTLVPMVKPMLKRG